MEKTLIIYYSEHHGNTEKIATAMAEEAHADLYESMQTSPELLNNIIQDYNIIGFGSGIYNGKHHDSVLNIVSKLPGIKDKKVFIFSTSGVDALSRGYHNELKSAIEKSEAKIAGEFNCLGYDTALISSGINHGKPDEKDINNAGNFIKSIFLNGEV